MKAVMNEGKGPSLPSDRCRNIQKNNYYRFSEPQYPNDDFLIELIFLLNL